MNIVIWSSSYEGAGGAEEIIQMGLKPLQMKRFANSVASVQQMVDITIRS